MKKFIQFLLIFIHFSSSSFSKDLTKLGLELNSFSQLSEKRTIFFKGSEFFDPKKDFNNKNIKDKTININYLSNEKNIVYQYCCDENSNASALFISKLNDANNKLTSLSDKQILELDKSMQAIKLVTFSNNKLNKFVYITPNNELILVSRDTTPKGKIQFLISKKILQKKYTLRTLENDYFTSPKFKQKAWDSGVIALNKDAISVSNINFTAIQSVSNDDLGIILENKSGNRRVVITNKNFKKIFYYGIWDGQRDLGQADQFLKKPVLNIMPPVYRNIFKSGKTIIFEKIPNYSFQDINSSIKKIEKLNQKLFSDIKKKNTKFNEVVKTKLIQEKKKEELLKQKKANEELQRYQAQQKRLADEKQKRIEKKRKEEESLKREAEFAKRMEYVEYGIYIVGAILALIASIYFKIFDKIIKIFKNFSLNKKSKNKTQKKRTLGYWLADWANSYDDPKRAAYNLTGIATAAILFTYWLFNMVDKGGNKDATGIFAIIFFITLITGAYYTYKIWSGVRTYHCPKCKRIFAGEVYKSKHTGSSQRAKKFKKTETIKNYKGKVVGSIESDEVGIVQTDNYHNWVKCLLCNHKWEYDSVSETRVS
tara:strand:+ start:1507 stop:3297 length:1791 start_codon:yes stop_codon:yes gene_type:complete